MGVPNNFLRSTNESLFNLVFSTKVVILVEIGLPTIRIEHYQDPSNSSWLQANLDLLEEIQNQAHLRMEIYQQWVTRYYNTQVKSKTFYLGDLVLW